LVIEKGIVKEVIRIAQSFEFFKTCWLELHKNVIFEAKMTEKILVIHMSVRFLIEKSLVFKKI